MDRDRPALLSGVELKVMGKLDFNLLEGRMANWYQRVYATSKRRTRTHREDSYSSLSTLI